MEEDVLGPREEAIGDRYVTCTRCGLVFPREQAALVRRELPEATLSEQAEVCPDCRRQLELGERGEEVPVQ